jgi:hypothetical protein
MAPRRSHVVTNRRKLDAFLVRGGKLEDLVLSVGQLSGKPKYPKSHVGSKSRGPRSAVARRITPFEAERRRQIRAARAYLQSITDPQMRKAETKRIRAEIKAEAKRLGTRISTKGLGRKVTAGTAVARVAGVLASESGYHIFALRERRGQVTRELDGLRAALLGRGSVSRALQMMGKNTKAAVRQRFVATRHVDTGRVLRNIQYQIIDKPTMLRNRARDKAERAAARAARKKRR